MKRHHLILAGILGLAATVGSTTLHAAEHHHDGHGSASAGALRLNEGRKWATDEALRQGMEALRAGFAVRHDAIRKGTLGPGEYAALGKKVDEEVAGIVARCKLEPRADAALHVIIAELVASAEIMQGKAQGKPNGGARGAIAALNRYALHFDHPGWKSLK